MAADPVLYVARWFEERYTTAGRPHFYNVYFVAAFTEDLWAPAGSKHDFVGMEDHDEPWEVEWTDAAHQDLKEFSSGDSPLAEAYAKELATRYGVDIKGSF